jgi:hypothetical protein
MTFPEVLMATAANRELVEAYDRLRGTSLAGLGRVPINDMIDAATGKTSEDVAGFVNFVYDVVWCRLPPGVVE